jgi:hypothetical protein
MPARPKASRRPLRRLTIIFEPALYAEIETVAKSIGLQIAPCARMLIIEALATRAAFPPMLSTAERLKQLQGRATPTAPRRPRR